MAVSKCPECNEVLSTSVKQCLYCGCKISACSKCGTLNKAESNVCFECGSQLENTKVINQNINTVEKNEYDRMTVEELVESCGKKGFYLAKNKPKFMVKIFNLIMFIEVIICLINIFLSLKEDIFPMNIVIYTILWFDMCGIAIAICRFWDKLQYYKGLGHFVKVNNVNIKSVVSNSIFDKKEVPDFFERNKKADVLNNIVTVQLINEGKWSTKWEWRSIVSNVLGFIQSVLVIIFLSDNFSNPTTTQDMGEVLANFFDSQSVELLFVVVVIAVIRIIAFEIISKKEKENRRDWIKSNCSAEVYSKYMANIYND